MLQVLILALTSLSQAGSSDLGSGWGLVTKATMSVDARDGPTIQNEIGIAWERNGKLIWGQVLVTPEDGLTLDIAARGCGSGVTDFRQNVTMPRKADFKAELRALTQQGELMFSVLAERCSLTTDARTEFMRGFEAAFRRIYSAYRG